jgi:hypothetical protein
MLESALWTGVRRISMNLCVSVWVKYVCGCVCARICESMHTYVTFDLFFGSVS